VATLLVALLLLFLFDKAPPDDLRVTFKRTMLVVFPASFAATAVDFIKKATIKKLTSKWTHAFFKQHSLLMPVV